MDQEEHSDDGEGASLYPLVSLSPCLLVSLSPCVLSRSRGVHDGDADAGADGLVSRV